MTPKVNYILNGLRNLVEQAAWGPEIPVHDSEFLRGVGGTGEASSNASDAQDMLDFYINNLGQALVDEFGIEDVEAFDYILEAAEELSDAGMLPDLPSEDDSDAQASIFLGSAKTLGFEGYCIKLVRDKLATVSNLRSMQSMRPIGMEDHIHNMGSELDMSSDID